MPLIEAGFLDDDGRPDNLGLVQHGPSVSVTIGYVPEGQSDPVERETVYALVDTGPTESHIDSKLAEKLNLPLVDIQPPSGVGGVPAGLGRGGTAAPGEALPRLPRRDPRRPEGYSVLRAASARVDPLDG